MLSTHIKEVEGQLYKVFQEDHFGYKDLMPKLREQGFEPVGVSFLMEARLKAIESGDADSIRFWLDNIFFTSDGVAYDGKRFKVVLDAYPLVNITENTKLNKSEWEEWAEDKVFYAPGTPGIYIYDPFLSQRLEGMQMGKDAVILTSDQYDELKGEAFSREELEKLGAPFETYLNCEQAKKHPVLQALANDQDLLDRYVETMSREAKKRYGYDEIMGVWVLRQKDVYRPNPTMLAWSVGGLHKGKSDVSGFEPLRFDPRILPKICLVGKSLEKRL